MDNLDTLFNQVARLNDLMKLDCENVNVLKEQVETISYSQVKLSQIYTDLESTVKVLDAEIARIDGIRLAQGLVGVGLILVGHSNKDNNSFIAQICSEITLNIGNDLLREAIRDENHLRELRQILFNLLQRVNILIGQAEQLKEIAHKCFIKSEVINTVNHQIDLPRLSANISEIATEIKFNFIFGQSELMKDQLLPLKLNFDKLIQFNQKLSNISSSIDQFNNHSVKPETIDTLISLFGCAITSLEIDHQGELIISIYKHKQRLRNLLQECFELEKQVTTLVLPAQLIIKFLNDFLVDSSCLELLQTTKESNDLDSLVQKAIHITNTVETRLNFDNPKVMQQKLNQMHQIKLELRNYYIKLDAVIKKINKQSNYPLNIDVIKAFFSLLGTSIIGLGLNSSGDMIFYFKNRSESVVTVINKCREIIKIIEKPAHRLAYFINLGQECITYANLITSLQEKQGHKNINDIKEEIKIHNKIIKSSLRLGNVKEIKQQIEEISVSKELIVKIYINITKIINSCTTQNFIYIKAATIEGMLLIFGTINAIEFNEKEELFIDYGNKVDKFINILKFCQDIKPTLEKFIQAADSKLSEAQECLNNPVYMRLQKQKQERRKLQIKMAVAASIILFASPLFWLGWNRFSQEQIRWKAQALVATIGDVNQATDINILKDSQQKIQKAITLLESIPNFFASAHSSAQEDIAKLREKLDYIEEKIKFEEQALMNLESAKSLAKEAANLVQNPPHSIEIWQEASSKWLEAIKLLESVPEGSYVSDEIKAKISEYNANYNNISQRLSIEEDALSTLDTAKKLSWEAAKMIQNPPHVKEKWKQAQGKLLQAINILKSVKNNTPIYSQAQQKLAEYQSSYTTITQRLTVEENASKNFASAKILAKQVEEIALNTPYTLESLKNAQAKMRQAINQLKNIPQGTTVSNKSSLWIQVYNSNYMKINERIKEIQNCAQQSYCWESNLSIYLESTDDLL